MVKIDKELFILLMKAKKERAYQPTQRGAKAELCARIVITQRRPAQRETAAR